MYTHIQMFLFYTKKGKFNAVYCSESNLAHLIQLSDSPMKTETFVFFLSQTVLNYIDAGYLT